MLLQELQKGSWVEYKGEILQILDITTHKRLLLKTSSKGDVKVIPKNVDPVDITESSLELLNTQREQENKWRVADYLTIELENGKWYLVYLTAGFILSKPIYFLHEIQNEILNLHLQ